MTILSVRFNELKIKDYALTHGKHLTIGRNKDNDIVIDSLAVSGYHARIESVATSFIIKDLDSTNGLFVNKQPTKQHTLQHNDVVFIGKHELVFDRLVFDRSARGDSSGSIGEELNDGRTRFLDTQKQKELVEQLENQNEPIEKPQKSLFSRVVSKFSTDKNRDVES